MRLLGQRMADKPHAASSAASSPDVLTHAETVLPQPVCVMSFNACDPCGAGGLTADITTIASVGGHPVAVACGIHARDTSRVFSHTALDSDLVADQARTVLEDMPIRAIKVGFAGTPASLGEIAEIASDYPDIPIISYMPDLSWWQEGNGLEEYLDAFEALVLPQTSVLVGSHGTLWRWLLPDWQRTRPPTARDIAKAAEARDVPYVLVTGIALSGEQVDNVLASAEAVLGSSRFELFDASFHGAGDTLSAALTALLAVGNDLGAAVQEALEYLDHSLGSGFRPGMGQLIPDRMFWAQPEDAETDALADSADQQSPADTTSMNSTTNETAADTSSHPEILETLPIDGFLMPTHDTKH